MELTHLTALELAELLRCGEICVRDAVTAAFAQIRMRESELNAFITTAEEQALVQAEHAQRMLSAGGAAPLAGVPFAAKDNLCTRGIKTTCASRMLGDFVPPYDATAPARAQAAGGVLLGKLNMDEFAMGSTSETSAFGVVKNPWDITRVPGGSSGGAAAAVAAGECWYALATDTGGSIRQPAAMCGVTGMKPTYGTVSRYGLIAYASSLDQIGPIARTAADCAAVLDIIRGKDFRDSTSAERKDGALLPRLDGDIRGLRVGIPEEYFDAELDSDAARLIVELGRVLEGRGAKVEHCTLSMTEYALPAYYAAAAAEASSNLARYDGVRFGLRQEDALEPGRFCRRTRTCGFGEEVRKRILLGTLILSEGYYDEYYRKALWAREEIRKSFGRAFQEYDLLLAPVAPGPAPKMGVSLNAPLNMYRGDRYTVPASLAGLPAASVPCGFDRRGLPVGAQLIGPAMADASVLRAAHAIQLDTCHHLRRPGEGEEGGK